jgi:hypothetical protein
MTLSLLEQSACLAIAAMGLATGLTVLDPAELLGSARSAYVAISEKSVESTYNAFFVKYGFTPSADDLYARGYLDPEADRATVEAAVAKMDRRAALAGL